MSTSFIKRLWSKPPQLFPLVALFHIGILLFYLYSDLIIEPVTSGLWIQPVYMLLYTVSWIFICDMKRWAAYAYIALTTLNLLLRFFVKDRFIIDAFTDVLFPADMLFTFFVMFYFKRFD